MTVLCRYIDNVYYKTCHWQNFIKVNLSLPLPQAALVLKVEEEKMEKGLLCPYFYALLIDFRIKLNPF